MLCMASTRSWCCSRNWLLPSTHLFLAASDTAEERFLLRYRYHQLTIYLAKLGLTENCLVSFGNLYYPPKPLDDLSSPLILKQQPEGLKPVQTDLRLPRIAISVRLYLCFYTKDWWGNMTYLVAARFPVWSNFCGFIYNEDEFSPLYQRKSVYGKELRNNKGEDFSFGKGLYCAQDKSFRLVVF